MTSPILTAHQIYPHFFNLGGRLTPVSIRDQMVRAQAFVDDAVAAGLIGGGRWRPLLVVGAGAAGATAAMWAAGRHRVPTVLVERDSGAFNRQANCPSRRIDPTQYDWPADHWGVQLCPYRWVQTPLPWKADLASNLAADWKVALGAVPSPPLDVYFDTVVTHGALLPGGPAGTALGWDVRFAAARLGAPRPFVGSARFGLVLWTVGFGSERSVFGDYAGFPFWEQDDFEQPNCGLPKGVVPDVVISGSGDGALQDFLRITTNLPSAAEILARCGISAASQARVRRSIYGAEDVAQRALVWGPGRRSGAGVTNDHDVLQALQDRHRALATSLLGNARVVAALDTLVRNDLPQIRLIHSCGHFANAYGLNRFLALLVGEYLRRHRSRPDVFIPRRRLMAVTHPNDGKCPSPPPPWRFGGPASPQPWKSCHGRKHALALEEALDCRFDPKPPVAAETINANVLIIRHGIDTAAIPSLPAVRIGKRLVPPLPDIALTRQVMAYRAMV